MLNEPTIYELDSKNFYYDAIILSSLIFMITEFYWIQCSFYYRPFNAKCPFLKVCFNVIIKSQSCSPCLSLACKLSNHHQIQSVSFCLLQKQKRCSADVYEKHRYCTQLNFILETSQTMLPVVPSLFTIIAQHQSKEHLCQLARSCLINNYSCNYLYLSNMFPCHHSN